MSQGKDCIDAPLTKYIYLTGAKFCLVCSDGDQALDGIVGDLGNLRVDPKAINLDNN